MIYLLTMYGHLFSMVNQGHVKSQLFGMLRSNHVESVQWSSSHMDWVLLGNLSL